MAEAIRGTNDDASASRLAAVSKGYFDDPYARLFSKTRKVVRPPVINRGSFIRQASLNSLMRAFISRFPANSVQVVSFGAGSDTRFFLSSPSLAYKHYYEIDFPQVTTRKAMIIAKTPELKALVGAGYTLAAGGMDLHGTTGYSLLSGDLCSFSQAILPKLLERGFDTSCPTIFLSECVLIYLDPAVSRHLIQWAAQCRTSLFATFEQILPEDAFGRVMLENLGNRGISLPGIRACPTIQAQLDRYKEGGFQGSGAIDMHDLHQHCMLPDTKARLDGIERLDELEEWNLLSRHYCVSWGVSGLDDEAVQALGKIAF
ncbi:MAG: hypothetical protein SGCHY_003887 [Lobulomycetales sp.]